MTMLQQSPLSGIAAATPVPAPRALGAINWVGFTTLTKREIRRFLKVWVQTIAAPVVTTLLFYSVFALALGGVVRMVGDVPFLRFLGPGLIMMGMAQNAFANTSSSVLVSKVQGNIVDVLMPPLSPFEFVSAFVTGGIVRGLMVGLVTWIVIQLVVPLGLHAPFYVLFHAVMASMLLSLLGLIGGIWADKFDHMAAITNFVITPLSFLSGTFYTLDSAPRFFHTVAHVNPFFYFIDGFRYGFIGRTDGTLGTGIAVMLGINLVLWLVALRMVSTGYKLKA
ncbi:ABC transporter permease [Nitrospirillum amazonense]|uniref:Transport permease protein n=1 Tax=Nitrospirillum amazonense TaxID=28077 RepID=A0A560JW59_9PROT|nr:ABC transporter permease [Nitrospirillum amazonense]MDG3440425.1 ABC transporter permease [Nitrospirillum amazonense]MEC4593259.1 ABC transporter permease [Nitrospirillum amazonense]TWB18875.1 ABC-2 type transport system permease protein [Nitrospirillum amazonense]TWB75237.1 ABC-2 type transport system permease protein [Nitrospirillum amazonense]